MEPGNTTGTRTLQGVWNIKNVWLLTCMNKYYDPDFLGRFLNWKLKWFSGREVTVEEAALVEGWLYCF